jgi:hypothetical protein
MAERLSCAPTNHRELAGLLDSAQCAPEYMQLYSLCSNIQITVRQLTPLDFVTVYTVSKRAGIPIRICGVWAPMSLLTGKRLTHSVRIVYVVPTHIPIRGSGVCLLNRHW